MIQNIKKKNTRQLKFWKKLTEYQLCKNYSIATGLFLSDINDISKYLKYGY